MFIVGKGFFSKMLSRFNIETIAQLDATIFDIWKSTYLINLKKYFISQKVNELDFH